MKRLRILTAKGAAMQNETIYIKTDAHNLTRDLTVRLGDVFRVEGTDRKLNERLKEIVLYHYPPELADGAKGKTVVVFSILKVIEQIHAVAKDVTVVNLGETDFIVELIPKKQQKKWIELIKLVLVGLLTFFGAAFTIMAFNNDISISGVFERFYSQVLGADKPAVTEIEICYSIGLAVGIMVFFNHIGKKKITMDPTPIQVELRKYESDVADTLIENASRMGHCEEVK
jgi:stage V sporulation protein AA